MRKSPAWPKGHCCSARSPLSMHLSLGERRLRVRERSVHTGRVTIGPTADPITYVFQTPYLALNQDNFQDWEASNEVERKRLLSRIVVGNLLSLSKTIGLHVAERLARRGGPSSLRLPDPQTGCRVVGLPRLDPRQLSIAGAMGNWQKQRAEGSAL